MAEEGIERARPAPRAAVCLVLVATLSALAAAVSLALGHGVERRAALVVAGAVAVLAPLLITAGAVRALRLRGAGQGVRRVLWVLLPLAADTAIVWNAIDARGVRGIAADARGVILASSGGSGAPPAGHAGGAAPRRASAAESRVAPTPPAAGGVDAPIFSVVGPSRDVAAHRSAGIWPGDRLPDRLTTSDASGCRVATLHRGGDGGAMLDFVIMSEGFTALEMPVFRATAEDMARTFLAFNPFSGLRDISTITAIETPSASGIDMPADVARRYSDPKLNAGSAVRYTPREVDTHLDGRWAGDRIDVQKEILLDDDKAYREAARLVPGFARAQDALVVIVNIPRAEAFYQHLSYHPLRSNPVDAHGLYLWHEWGHHLGLGDEEFDVYWRDAKHTSAYPNKTTNANLHDVAHPWRHFFTPLSVKADIRDAERWNWDRPAYDPAIVNGRSIMVAGFFPPTPRMIPRPQPTTTHGPGYRCAMNHTGGGRKFCPVCAELMVRRVYQNLGRTFDDHAFHHRYKSLALSLVTWHLDRLQLWVNGAPVPIEKQSFILDEHALWRIDLTPHVRKGRNRIELAGEGFLQLDTLQVVNGNGAVMPIEPDAKLARVAPQRYLAAVNWPLDDGPVGFTLEVE